MIGSALGMMVLAGMLLTLMCILGCIYRILRGPTLADRAVGADTLSVLLIAGSLLISMRTGTSLYLDIAIVLALLGFAGTAALAQYIAKRPRSGGTP